MSGEENAGKQPDRPKGRSMPVFTAVVAFSLGVMAQRSGAVDEFAEVVHDIPRPDFDECVDQLLDSSEGKSIYSQRVESIRYRYSNVPMLDPEDIVSESVIAVCNTYAEKGVEDLKRYFNRTTENKAKATYRRYHGMLPMNDYGDLAMAGTLNPEFSYARQERLRLFEDCCERLNYFERAVVEAHIKHGLPWEAIGTSVGKPMSERKARREFNVAMERLKTLCPGLVNAF